jgi:hypothetical protein
MARKGNNAIGDVRARTCAKAHSARTGSKYHASKNGGYKSGSQRWQPSKGSSSSVHRVKR